MNLSHTIATRAMNRIVRRRRPQHDLAALVQARNEIDDPRNNYTDIHRI